jgi:hypothetical protein
MRKEHVHHFGNLGASPPEFAVAGPEGVAFKLR